MPMISNIFIWKLQTIIVNLATSGFVKGKGDSASYYPVKISSFRDSLVYSFKNYRPPKHRTLFISFLSIWYDPYNSQNNNLLKTVFIMIYSQ